MREKGVFGLGRADPLAEGETGIGVQIGLIAELGAGQLFLFRFCCSTLGSPFVGDGEGVHGAGKRQFAVIDHEPHADQLGAELPVRRIDIRAEVIAIGSATLIQAKAMTQDVEVVWSEVGHRIRR